MSSVQRKTTRSADAVLSELRDQILDGLMSPGQRLVETELIHDFGVSRNTLREAIAQLKSEGLVEIRHQRGASVVRLTRQSIRETFGIRERLETYAISLAAARGPDAQKKTWLLEQREVWTSHFIISDSQQHMSMNIPFHEGLLEMSGNRRLATLINSLQLPSYRARGARFFDEDYRASSADDHIKIIDAILAGDSGAAQQVVSEHVSKAEQLALKIFAGPAA